MRAIVPAAIGVTAGGGLTVRWILNRFLQRAVEEIVVHTGNFIIPSLIGFDLDISRILDFIWYSGGVLICWELRVEIFYLVLHICAWLIWISQVVLGWFSCERPLALVGGASIVVSPKASRTERYCDLTCMAALGGLPYPPGSFVLISRPPDWDEIWVAGYTDKQDIIGRTTAPDGSDWIWCLVRPAPNATSAPQIVGGNRRVPAGVPQNSANWMCVPPECNNQWDPEAVEVVALTQEAVMLANQIKDNPGAFPINQAGVAGPLIPILVGGNMGPGGLVVAGAAGGQGAGGLGLPGEGGQSPNNAELKALETAVAQLQQLALSPQRKKDKGRKSKKEKKHDKKSKKKKKKKKKSKRSSSSGTSSSSSRSRSRSSSSSSSTSSGKTKPLRWKERGRDKKVTYGNLAAVDQLKLKKRGDLLAFAAKSPGALTAHFLAGVYARLSKGTVNQSSQLREASAVSWAHQFSGLTEVRDQKEVLTLCEILDHVNRREIARALDILVQRIVAIQSAKAKSGSWEKAESLELVSTQRSLASSSMLALTNN